MPDRSDKPQQTDIRFGTCKYCGKVFSTPRSLPRVSCSDECKRRLIGRRTKDYRPRRRCSGCDGSVRALDYSHGKRFCSEPCEQAVKRVAVRAKANQLARELIGSLCSCTRCGRHFAGRRAVCYSCRRLNVQPVTTNQSLGVGVCKCGRHFDRILSTNGRCLQCEQKAKRNGR